jgi:hypothetical protein
MIVMISFIGIRYLSYFRSFFFQWRAYRQREKISISQLYQVCGRLPHLKIQITTRGVPGTTEVITRGIHHIVLLVREDLAFYRNLISIEVITESMQQKIELERAHAACPLPVNVIVLPKHYRTRRGTQFKARALHYMVELRHAGYNARPNQRCYIVHFDEESVIEAQELRNLLFYLARHPHVKLCEGPIYYPFEYWRTSAICRVMEANRPIGCFECREVMQQGIPLHLHGSNLVIDEQLENELGWDIGNLDGQPLIAEDYVFGVNAYLRYGSSVFGWHGCVMLEQPPFSLKSAFKQRHRWITGVLQGLVMMRRDPLFDRLPAYIRRRLTWGTYYRIATFAAGLPAGVVSLCYVLYQAILFMLGIHIEGLPFLVALWTIFLGLLWLNSIGIGAYYNISTMHESTKTELFFGIAEALALAPLAGILESCAGFWAVVQWCTGKRAVHWEPTPKTKSADQSATTGKQRR